MKTIQAIDAEILELSGRANLPDNSENQTFFQKRKRFLIDAKHILLSCISEETLKKNLTHCEESIKTIKDENPYKHITIEHTMKYYNSRNMKHFQQQKLLFKYILND